MPAKSRCTWSPSAVAVGADHDAVRVQHVVDRGALAQELGVGHVADAGDPGGLELGGDALAGADRHRALHDEQPLAAARAHVAHHPVDARHVGVARRRRRRVDGDEKDTTGVAELVVGGREREALASAGEKLVETWLVDGHAPCAQRLDLGLVDVETHDPVAEMGDAHGRHETHVPDSDDPDAVLRYRHGPSSLPLAGA